MATACQSARVDTLTWSFITKFLPNFIYGLLSSKYCIYLNIDMSLYMRRDARTHVFKSIGNVRFNAQLQRLACSKSIYDTFQSVNNTGTDQTAQMRRLVCFFVVRKP